nr:hypothetical protein [Tanacetum cinerariifolium]
MGTRSTSSNLFSPLRDPESLIRRRNLGEPSSLFDFEEVMSIPHNNLGLPLAGPPPPNNNGPPLVQNGVSDDALHLSLFPYSLTHHATAWYDHLNKMYKAFPLPVIKFPLAEEVPTARESLQIHITFFFHTHQEMDHQYPTVAKILVLDTGKFKQWKFRMQQYLQHEHYTLWEVIEFGDSYEVPANDPSTTTTNTTSGEAGTKSRRTVTLTTEEIQKTKNDVKARTTLQLSLPNKHQLRFRECRAPRSQDRGRRDNFRQGSKAEEQAPKALMAIEGSKSKITDLTDKLFDAKNMIYHYKLALAQVESRLVEYKEREVKYIEKIRTLEYYHESKKEVVDGKLVGLLTASKDLDNLIESQRSDKSKEGLGYTAIPPPLAQLYLSPKKDLSWTGLPECADDTLTDYSRPSPTVESSPEGDQNRNPSVSENIASPITPKPFFKFVKASDSQSNSKTDEKETPKKPPS